MARRERWIAAAMCVIAVCALGPPGAAAQTAELPALIVTLSGRAEVSRAASPAWKEAALRDEVGAGDGVRALGGRVTLGTGSGQSLRLGPRTQTFFTPPAGSTPAGPIRVRMDGGRLWLAVLPNQPPPGTIEVRAGPVTVTVRGGGASIAMNPDGSVLVGVYHGSATCAGAGWERVLVQDQELLVPAAATLSVVAKLKRDKQDADWVKWNEQQDRAGGYGARIVPD